MNKNWIVPELPIKIKEEIEKIAKSKKLKEAEKVKLIEKIKKRYKGMQITPGESIGIVAAQSIGEPGTQMSLKYDEEVLVKYKEHVRTVKIGEFIDAIIETQPIKHERMYEIYDIPENENIEVLSLNNKEKLVWKKVRTVSRHKNHEELLKLKLRSGREITSTKSHSFVIRKNNKIVPIAGKDLKLGDRVPVLKSLNFEKELNAIDVSAFNKGAKHKLPEILELTEQLGWIFGAYLAEGNATPNYVNISNNSQVFMQQIRSFSNEFNLTTNVYQHSRGFSNSTDIRINSTALSNLLKASCGTGSYNKKSPNFATNANKKFVSGLLRAYFDGDGNISVDRRTIRAYSKSKKMINGIALLLSRFGIFSRKSTNKNGYTLTISYRYADIFLKEIGLEIPEKLARLKELAKIVGSGKQYNITEMYIGFSDVLYQLAKKLNYPKRLVNNFSRRQKIGRFTLKKYIEIFSELADKQKIDVQNELNILTQMYKSDVIWDEIVSMEYIKDKHEHLYDFSVDGLETFTTTEGIVTHNTMRTFHFVGVAEMSVTTGLPRIIEILDIRKEPKTPTMWVYLNKPYNKSRKAAEKIANKIKQVTLGQLAKEISIDLSGFRVNVALNRDELRARSVTTKAIAEILEKQIKGVKVDRTDGTIKLTLKTPDIKKLYKLKEKARGVPVAGIKGVTNVLPVWRRDSEEFVIQTYGSNLKIVFQVEEVDENRTTSNNIHEVAKVLGIEAARQTIINELIAVLEEQGMPVDERHILLVADLMCGTGELRGITRHGITSQKTSVLARASFEIPLKHLIDASIVGETDELASVVENIMVNQPIPVGTGLPDLVVRMKGEEKKPTQKKKK